MKLGSKMYPEVAYERGEDVYLFSGEAGLPFSLDIDSELTEKDGAMAGVAGILDEAEAFAAAARDCLRAALENEEDEWHETVSFFMRFHLEELEMEEAQICFGTEDPGALSAREMVDALTFLRFGVFWNAEEERPGPLLDLGFSRDITDEVLAVTMDCEKRVMNVAHES